MFYKRLKDFRLKRRESKLSPKKLRRMSTLQRVLSGPTRLAEEKAERVKHGESFYKPKT